MRSEIGQLSWYFHEIFFLKSKHFQSKYYNFKQGLISRLSQQLTLCFVQLKCRLRKFGYSVQQKTLKNRNFDLDLEWFLDAKKYFMYLSLEFIIDNGIFCHFICYINFLNQLWLWKFVFSLESFCILGKVYF